MSNSPVEEIKTRLDIVDFINSHVPLKRAGANFAARCPFHSEKTPSFTVSRAKQFWYCFGACQEGGDIFNFLMKMEGLEFAEALKILADKAGVELPKYDKRTESKKNVLLDIMKAAVAFYVGELNGTRGTVARQYLAKRGLSEAVIKQFSLGYAPDSWDALTTHLRNKFKAEDAVDAGLLIRKQRSYEKTAPNPPDPPYLKGGDWGGFYDRFRHRIVFPIRNVHGATVGFTSRLLEAPTSSGVGAPTSPSANVGGKYVNTPETPIYSKSRVLYGLDLARETVRRNDYAVVVEGNMDVIACHQFGMSNVVAASGTALTLDQVRLLKRYTNNLKIAFDSDPAGESAAKRGIDVALVEGMRIKVITIPQECGKDPDECIRKDIKLWEEAVRGAKEIMDYYIERARSRFDIRAAQGRSQFVNTLLTELIKLPDLVEQDFWLKKIGEIVKVDERLLREQMGRLRIKNEELRMKNDAVVESIVTPPRPSRAELLSERLLALFLAAPECADQIIGNVLPEMLALSFRQLYINLTVCYTAYNSLPGSDPKDPNFRQFWRNWAAKEAPNSLSTTDILELRGDREFDGWQTPQFKPEAHFLITALRREHLYEARRALAQRMKEAESAGDRARVAELAREFETLRVQESKYP